ncbi:MAG: hypothetical protein GY953_46980 [bacterium]|nr:hypothetical protein [bacterium]
MATIEPKEEQMNDYELDELVEEVAGEEVGRLFKRSNRKRRRRILGAILGGPLGMLGAGIAKRRSKRRKQRRELAGPRQPESHRRSITAGTDRRQPFGFGTQTIAAGNTGTLTQRVQKAFQPERLILSSPDPLSNIEVTDIKIGTISQLAGVGAVGAALFDALAEDAYILFKPAPTGVDVTIEVTNLDATNPHDLTASFIGITAEE